MPAIVNSNNVLLGGNGGGGSVNYEGVAPIVVNNEEYKISANAWSFEPGDGVQFVDNTANSSTTINVTGVTGKVDNSTFTSFTATADVQAYTAGNNINITNHVISGKNWSNEINAKLDATAINGWDSAAYSAGSNINITNHTISGKDWTNTITAASAYAAAQATGKEYTGIAPIVVNNTTDQISADTTELIAGNGIEFVTAANSTTINCTAAGGSYELSYNSPATGYTGNSDLRIIEYVGQTGTSRTVYSSTHAIGELVPPTYMQNQYLTTNGAGNMVWTAKPDFGIPVQAVATSAEATGGSTGVLYIVTGE